MSSAAATPGAFLRPALHVLPSGRSAEWRDAQTDQPSISKNHDQAPIAESRKDTCDAKSYPFPVWSGLLTRKHWARIGNSLWIFLWLLDRTTLEKDGWGIVLGGKPVRDEEIATCFGFHSNKTANHRRRLLRSRYIEATRTPYGFVYRVRNSRKFGIWGKKRSTEIGDSLPRDPPKPVTPDPPKPVETKKTMQLDHAAKAASSEPKQEEVWSFLGIRPCGPPRFQSLLESRWASRNGEPRSALIGETIDAWAKADGQKPARCASLFRALSDLRRREEQGSQTAMPRSRMTTVKDIRPKER